MAPHLNILGKTSWVPLTGVCELSLVACFSPKHANFLDFICILHSNDTVLRLPGTQQKRYLVEYNG